jgi:phage repressor protein C with HTH and peptisase S24 domain
MIDRERLRYEMNKQRLSQSQLAKAAGVSSASIQQILNGSVRSPRSLRKIAEVLGVAVDWLEGVSEDAKRAYLEHTTPEDTSPVVIGYFSPDMSLGGDNISARAALFGKGWLTRIDPEASASSLILYRVSSSEMAPTILPGDDAFVKVKLYDEDPDGIWIFNIGDRWYCRRVRRVDEEHVRISADNPTIASFDERQSTIRFFGRVIWQGRKLGS